MIRKNYPALAPLAALLLLFLGLTLPGCGSPPPNITSQSTVAIYYAGDPQAAVNFHHHATGEDNSYGLHQSMLGSAYLAMGDSDDAYRAIRTAYTIMNGYMTDQGGDPHFYKPESDKTFIGDPVEMSLNSWYMAVLNFQRHDYSNCVAACKNAILADQPLKWEEQSEEDAKKGVVPTDHYVDDNGMLYLLEVRGMMRAGGWSKEEIAAVVEKGKASFLRCQSLFDPTVAKARVDQLFTEAQNPDNNVIFVVDLGLCPRHRSSGQHDEMVKIEPVYYADTNARLMVNGQAIPTERVCDVGYQAVHRGERNFDETLKGRAAFKDNATEGGKSAVVVGAAMMTSDNATVRGIGLGVAAIGAAFWIMGGSTEAAADLRQWEVLPGQVNMVWIPMKPGQYTVTCEGLTTDLRPLDQPRTCARTFEVKAGSDTLVYLRPLPACPNPTLPPPPPPNQAGDKSANDKAIQQSNDMGKDAFAKEKARKEAEDKAKQEQDAKPAPVPAPPSSSAPAPATSTASTPAAAPATTPVAAAAPAATPVAPGTWSTTETTTPTSTSTTPSTPATPASGTAAPAPAAGNGTWTEK